MNAFRDHLFNLRDRALEHAMRAREDLTRVVDEYEDSRFISAIEQVAHTEPYARWWMAVTEEIEHSGLDPMAALTKVRTAARQSLLHTRIPWRGSWFSVAHSHVNTEATRRFYNETARFNLETITGTGPAIPTITGTAPPCPGASSSHRATSPTWPPAIDSGPAARPHTGPDTHLHRQPRSAADPT